jgi:hypothetical protein
VDASARREGSGEVLGGGGEKLMGSNGGEAAGDREGGRRALPGSNLYAHIPLSLFLSDFFSFLFFPDYYPLLGFWAWVEDRGPSTPSFF